MLLADAVLIWNSIATDAVAHDHASSSPSQQGPTRTARALAIVHAAIFDAVNAIDQSHKPYVMSRNRDSKASMEAAIAQASHDTLSALYPTQSERLDIELKNSLDAVPDGRAEKRGIAIGERAAKKIMRDRRNDGSGTDPFHGNGVMPGDHRPDPLHPDQGLLTPGWGKIRPFALTSGSQFRSPPPPALDSDEYAAAFEEVKMLGGDGVTTPTVRTEEQTHIGMFWGYDGMPGIGTPPRLYNQIAQTIAIQQGNSLVQNARLFALVNLAMADAGIAAWDTKYAYDFWRPILGIREADAGTGPSGLGDGNPATTGDPTWTPLGMPYSNGCDSAASGPRCSGDLDGANMTPPFPAYTSGHAAFGAALFRTLELFYGKDDIPFQFTSDELNGITRDSNGEVRPLVTRTFASFSQAAEENGQSRIYLGIHWSFDKTAGISQGKAVADHIFERLLLPRRGHSSPIPRPASAVVPHADSTDGTAARHR